MSARNSSFRARGGVCLLAVVLILVAAPSASAQQMFTATLAGAQEVPAVATPGTGLGTVILNAAETEITVNLTFSGLTSTAILGHIHGAAAPGVEAGVLFDFAGDVAALNSNGGTIPARTFAISPAQVAELRAGLYYFNVHSVNFGGGEIRGQIGLAATQFTTTLTGVQQVPPVQSGGTGTGIAALNATEDQLIVNLTFSGLTTPAILAHIHGPAAPDGNAGVLFDFASVVPAATSGTIPQQVFAISPAQVAELKAGLYYFNIHTTNFPGGEIRGQLTSAAVSLDRASLRFAATTNGAAFVQQTPTQTVRILQSGTGTVSWTATPSAPWITVSPTSGTGTGVITIGVTFAAGLPFSGTTPGSVSLSIVGSSNPAGPIVVSLATIPVGASASPVGLFETPTQGATGITGSIAVTGWAVDDVAVSRVRIVRDPVAGEGSALIFIGDAVLIDGARPDVAAAFPTMPLNTRTGWGYLMLTNFLPNAGNGTFVIHAIADDVDGHSVELGTKTITCANDTATRPFGAIDTPGQGETVSGSSVANFGWVLSRGPALAFPPNGTVQILVDGAFLPQSPVGWTSRADLTMLFPAATYPGVANALGLAAIDSTTLANGVHTIAWIVTANNLEADGIGSRFFSVANGTGGGSVTSAVRAAPRGSVTIAAPEPVAMTLPNGTRVVDAVNQAPLNVAPIVGRRGYDAATRYRAFMAGANGRVTVQGEEMDRIELRLAAGSGSARDGDAYRGYLRAGDALEPLPIGSRLNAATGEFTWQPGVGFVRGYDFVFVRWSGTSALERQEVRIVLNPRGSNRVGPQVIIDVPAASRTVQQPFTVAGWAIDPDASTGTGVDTLHVWAYPRSGCATPSCDGPPIFLGATAYGGRRPDVGALFGDRFRDSGYGLIVDSLPPGTYDLAVFAWSTAAGNFVPAKVVRVTVR